MLNVLATGSLIRDPERRHTSAGKPYATALMRVPSEDSEAIMVSVIAFNADAVAALLALAKGDALAVAGRAKLTTWQKNGEDRHGLSVIADRVMSAYAAGKTRKATRDAEEATA